jgi:hypothetical protein
VAAQGLLVAGAEQHSNAHCPGTAEIHPTSRFTAVTVNGTFMRR